MTAKHRTAIYIGSLSGAIAIISALPILEMCSDSSICGYFVFFAFPGILLSMAVSGNVHAFNPRLVVVFNWIFYALAIWVSWKVIRKFREN
jgi:hypothetical protein